MVDQSFSITFFKINENVSKCDLKISKVLINITFSSFFKNLTSNILTCCYSNQLLSENLKT